MREGLFNRNHISLKLLTLILLTVYLPRYMVWTLCIVVVLISFVHNRRAMLNISPASFFIFLIMIVGTLSGIGNALNSGVWPFLRDIILVSYYFLYWQLGMSTCKNDRDNVVTTIFTACWIIGLINTPQRVLNFINGTADFQNLVSTGSVSYVINGIGLFLVFFRPQKGGRYYNSELIEKIADVVIIFTFFISFSRSSIIVFVILALANSHKRAKPIVSIIIIGIVALITMRYVVPDVYTTFWDKVRNSFNELTGNNITFWSSSSIVHDWRAYEVYCAKKQFGSFNNFEKIVGHGFGTLIDAQGYSYLVTKEDGLAILHNGYYTTLIKTGILGLVNYAFAFISMICSAIYKLSGYEKRLSLGLLVSELLTTSFVNGTLFGGANFVFVLMLTYCFSQDKV